MEQVTQQGFTDLLNQIDSETTRIGNDLIDIKDQVKKYGLPAEAEANIFSRLQRHADALKAMGKISTGSPVTDQGSPVTDAGSFSPSTDIV